MLFTDPMIDAAAAAIANARGNRRGAPAIVNVLDLLPEKLRAEVREDAQAALADVDIAAAKAADWRVMDSAPRDGTAFWGFGVHTTDNGRHWHVGAYWWGLILWDVYREPHRWVFSKDGTPTWSEPLRWQLLPPPPEGFA